MTVRLLLTMLLSFSVSAFAQVPAIEPGVSQDLAKWRAGRYSDVRYKLNLTLEKMSPVLKGSMEIRVTVDAGPRELGTVPWNIPIVLDWRKIRGSESLSTVSSVSVNGVKVTSLQKAERILDVAEPVYEDRSEHLIFMDAVRPGENVIKLDFTSPILTSGSAITRYVDKEDGSEYLYSLFVPSDASTAFPVFDQPDIKARFSLRIQTPESWKVIYNEGGWTFNFNEAQGSHFWPGETKPISTYVFAFAAGPFERISSPGVSSPHVSKGAGDNSGAQMSQAPSLTVGLQTPVDHAGGNLSGSEGVSSTADKNTLPTGRVSSSGGSSPHVSKGAEDPQAPSLTVGLPTPEGSIYVRKSQAAKFKPHAPEVFRLNREAVRYFEEYFDYKFPFPKYDLVLIPEFPFGGMEHAGATFLRESSIIFPQEPTKNDHISRATLIFHEAAHQWFGDTVTMRWFDDLWLKEGFATFTAYKAMEKIMPEMNAWKVFYERVKQAAYQTDSTRGTTAIYQPITNLSSAKSAYGNIVYNKAPAFLRQAEFYLGEDEFRAAVRSFLKKHEFGNAGWEDLVKEFGVSSGRGDVGGWAERWVLQRGVPVIRASRHKETSYCLDQSDILRDAASWPMKTQVLLKDTFGTDGDRVQAEELFTAPISEKPTQTPIDRIFRPRPLTVCAYPLSHAAEPKIIFPNYGDYGYGIFLLDDKSRESVLKNIQNEKDPFLRSMMWGALWDSVREGELDPREYVELVVAVLSNSDAFTRSPVGPPKASAVTETPKGVTLTQEDESTTALLLNRVGTAMNYYIDDSVSSPRVSKGALGTQAPSLTVGLRTRVEEMLIAGMRNSPTLGQRITYYRAFLNIASSEKARGVLKDLLAGVSSPRVSKGAVDPQAPSLTVGLLTLRTKDKFDIVTRLLILNDPAAPKLLADLEKTETGDDAKRYAYAARAGIPTAENKAKYWNDFVNNKEVSESWIEAAFGPWNSIRHSDLTLPYLERALKELPNHKRNRKIFFVNGWLGAFIGGQRSEVALATVNKFLADNPKLDNDLRLKILENVDVIERAVRIRGKYSK